MMTDSDGLLEQGADVLAAVDAYVSRSEQRQSYREEHNRTLSKAHRQQLEGLRERLDRIIDPAPDTATLRAEFDGLCERLEAIE
jgi:hypothetical protein